MIEGFEKPFSYVHRSFINESRWLLCWALDHSPRLLTLHFARDFEQRIILMRDTLGRAQKEEKVDALHH